MEGQASYVKLKGIVRQQERASAMTMPTASPTELDHAILSTLLYGDLFDFAMSAAEIHHFLIGVAAEQAAVEAALQSSPWLAQYLCSQPPYYSLRPELLALRAERAAIAALLLPRAIRYGVRLAHLPFVEFVALTGSLAMQNPHSINDDFDYLLVSRPGRVWLTRLFAVVGVRLARLWGVELCPNYVLSSADLRQHRQDLYIAHELLQMIPIAGFATYVALRQSNPWAVAFLPNAQGCFYPLRDAAPQKIGRRAQALGSWLLAGRLGDWLEAWEQQRKARRFMAQASAQAHSAAEINAERVKGHFEDYGHRILELYAERLAAYGLPPRFL